MAIIGAGAVGSVFGAYLSRAGFDCEMLRYYDRQKSESNISDITIITPTDEVHARVRACNSFSELSSKKDYIFVLTRAYDTKAVVLEAIKYLNDNGKIVLLQNYFTAPDIVNYVSPGVLLGLIIQWSVVRRGENTFEIIRPGNMIIGAFSVVHTSVLDRASEVLSYISDVRITNNILGEIYSRVIINSCVSGVGALCGDRLGKMLTYKNAKNIFTGIIREAVSVAEASGIHIEKYNRHLDYYKIVGSDAVSSIRRRFMYFKLAIGNPYVISSVLRAIENNKRSQIEYLCGMIKTLGDRRGVSTPYNDRVVVMVQEIEQGKRSIMKDNLLDEVFLR